jgi:hypothetical protein
MKVKARRTVLAFYGPDEAESARAYESLAVSGLHIYRCRSNDSSELPARESWTRYAALRLDDECLIIVRTAAADVQSVVQRFQGAGSPAVFVLSDPPDPAGSNPLPRPSDAVPGDDFARE